MNVRTVIQAHILRRAKERVAHFDCWTVGVLARDESRQEVSFESHRAVAFSARGAVVRAVYELWLASPNEAHAVRWAGDAVIGLLDEAAQARGYEDIDDFNNSSRVRHTDVLQLLVQTLARMEAEHAFA